MSSFPYLVAFIVWILLAIFYIHIKHQSKIIKKSQENNATYITPKVYLKLHSDNVISSLYKKDKLIADDVLEVYENIFTTHFVTIFGMITYNHITGKFKKEENNNH